MGQLAFISAVWRVPIIVFWSSCPIVVKLSRYDQAKWRETTRLLADNRGYEHPTLKKCRVYDLSRKRRYARGDSGDRLGAVAPQAQRPAGSRMEVAAAEKRVNEKLTEPSINIHPRQNNTLNRTYIDNHPAQQTSSISSQDRKTAGAD